MLGPDAAEDIVRGCHAGRFQRKFGMVIMCWVVFDCLGQAEVDIGFMK